MTEIADRVKAVIADRLDIVPADIREETRLVADLDCDDIDRCELIMEFEDAFGCEITQEDAEAFVTVGDVIRYLEAKR